MQSMAVPNVALCGENPHIVLYRPETKRIAAAASYWDCSYSVYGEGRVLILAFDEENADWLRLPRTVVYANNPRLARYLVDELNRHYDEWTQFDIGGTPVREARFFKQSDSRSYYRVDCRALNKYVELVWRDVRRPSFRIFPDFSAGVFGLNGGDHYHVTNVVSTCGFAEITVNARAAYGIPHTQTQPDGEFSSSVYLTHAATWLRADTGTHAYGPDEHIEHEDIAPAWALTGS